MCTGVNLVYLKILLSLKDNTNEPELIRDLKQGSRDAFNTIYKMYSKRLYAYCLQLTKSKEESEEIVQDVFVRLWTNREKIRKEETVRSLLYIMAKHYFVDAYRAKVNSPVYEAYVNHCESLSVEDGGDRFEFEEFKKLLNTCLDRLPATQRKIIKLSRFQQLSNREVAEKMSLSEQTIKNQLSLGLRTLRAELNKVLVWLLMLLCIN